MIYTTLNRIRQHSPCNGSWKKLLKALGKTKADDARLSYERVYKILGIADALWACRVEPQYAREWRLLAVAFARRTKPTDPRSIAALEVAVRYAHGKANDEELAAARFAARFAAGAAAWAASEAAGAAGAAGAAAWTAERQAQAKMFLKVVRETKARGGAK